MDEIIQSLRKSGRAAFRTREYAALLGKKGYARLALHRLKMRGEIISVRNGWWAFPDSMPEAIACGMSNPCYVSFHSALALHGLTSQAPRTIQLAVARKAKKYLVNGLEAREYRVKSFGGFQRKDALLLASPEKAVADSLNTPRACPDIVLAEAMHAIDKEAVGGMLDTDAAKKRLKRLIRHVEQERTG